MSTVRRIAKNTTVILLASVVSFLLSFFFVMYAARYLGAAGFGILSFALAFTGIFSLFADLGMSRLTIREVARDKSLARKYVGNISVIKIILVTATFGLIALTINLLGYPDQTIKAVYLVGLSVVFYAFTSMFYSIFQAFERMEFVAAGNILNSLLLLLGALFAIQQGFSVIGFASIYFLAGAIVLVYSITISFWKFVAPRVEIDSDFWKWSIKEAWPFALSALFMAIYYQIDTVMLSLMQGDIVVGWYNAAYRLVFVLLFIPAAFSTAIFPAMSKFYVSSRGSLRYVHEKFFKYMVILAIPIGIGTTLLADKIIPLIFGSDYTSSIIALQILIWSSVFIFGSSAFLRLFESLNKQIIVTKVTGGCALLNVVLNLLLIPKYSYIGASVATVATQFTVLLLVFIWGLKTGYGIPKKKVVDIFCKVVISGAVMGIFVKYLDNLSLFALIPLSALLYFAILYIVRGIDRNDVQLFKGLIKG